MQRTKLAQAVATLAVGAALMTAASGAFAQSAVLKVTGTLTPAACTPTLGGAADSTIDFGAVTPGGEYSKDTSLQITCTAPTFVAFKVTDNRNGTQVGADLWSSTAGAALSWLFPNQSQSAGTLGWNDQLFGLGKTSKNQNIGAYTLQLGKATVTGSASFLNSSAWVTTTGVSFSDQVPLIGGLTDTAYKAISSIFTGLGWNGQHGLWITRAGPLGGAAELVGGKTGLYVAKGFKYTAVNAVNIANIGDIIPTVGFGFANATDGKVFSFPMTVRAKVAEGIATGDAEKLDGQATFDLVYI